MSVVEVAGQRLLVCPQSGETYYFGKGTHVTVLLSKRYGLWRKKIWRCIHCDADFDEQPDWSVLQVFAASTESKAMAIAAEQVELQQMIRGIDPYEITEEP